MRSKSCVTSIAALCLCIAAGTPTQAQSIQVQADGHTFAISPFEFAGTATFLMDEEPVEVEAYTILLDMLELPNGWILVETSHTFDFGAGDTLVTSDRQILVPTETPGLYELHSVLKIAGGSGIFEGAKGNLRGLPESTINFGAAPPEALWHCAGVIVLKP